MNLKSYFQNDRPKNLGAVWVKICIFPLTWLIMEHVSRRVGIQVGQHTFTDIDYADDVALLVDKEESFHTALTAMDEEASKFGLRVSWTKTKIQNQNPSKERR